MATVTPEQMKKALSSLSALEGMASGYCELQDGFDTSKGIAENVRQVLAALAAPPAEDARDYVAELRECHELLTSCVGGVDPDEHPGLVARINVVLGGCDVAGVCPAPVDPVPGSVDYWREVAARLGAEVKLMADALKGTTEQRDDALAKLTTAQAPPASDPPGLVKLRDEMAKVRARTSFLPGAPYTLLAGLLQSIERIADRALAAYPLPASPQAETAKGDE